MRYLGALAMVVLGSSCGSFGAAPTDTTPSADAAVDDAARGGDGGVACDAKRCIEFESPAQRASPFGFDRVESAGEVAIVPGEPSSGALRTKALDEDEAYGVVNIATTPPELRVVGRVRRGGSVNGTWTSTHFFDVVCPNGGPLVALKLDDKGELSVQINANANSALGTLVAIGEWVNVELLVRYGPAKTTAQLTRFGGSGDGPAKTELGIACTRGVDVRIGSHLYGEGNTQSGEYEVTVDDLVIDWN